MSMHRNRSVPLSESVVPERPGATRRRLARRVAMAGAVVATVLVASACGADSEKAAVSPPPTPVTTPTPTPTPEQLREQAVNSTVRIVVKDSLTGSLAAGTGIVLPN